MPGTARAITGGWERVETLVSLPRVRTTLSLDLQSECGRPAGQAEATLVHFCDRACTGFLPPCSPPAPTTFLVSLENLLTHVYTQI